jgi:hypothetical protein
MLKRPGIACARTGKLELAFERGTGDRSTLGGCGNSSHPPGSDFAFGSTLRSSRAFLPCPFSATLRTGHTKAGDSRPRRNRAVYPCESARRGPGGHTTPWRRADCANLPCTRAVLAREPPSRGLRRPVADRARQPGGFVTPASGIRLLNNAIYLATYKTQTVVCGLYRRSGACR